MLKYRLEYVYTLYDEDFHWKIGSKHFICLYMKLTKQFLIMFNLCQYNVKMCVFP